MNLFKTIIFTALMLNLIGLDALAATVFKAKVNVAECVWNSQGISNPDVAVDRNYIYIAWEDVEYDESVSGGVFLSRSVDGGVTFEEKIRLDESLGVPSAPEIAIGTDGSVIVMYVTFDIENNISVIMKRSFDNGLSFQTDVISTLDFSLMNMPSQSTTDLQVNGDAIGYIWANARGCQLFLSKDRGANFDHITINTPTDNNVERIRVPKDPVVSLQSDGSVFVLRYEYGDNSLANLYFSKLANNSDAFSDSILIAETNSFVGFTTQESIVTTTDGYTYLIWNQAPADYSDLEEETPIFFTHSEDDGESFSGNNKICFDGGTCSELIYKTLIDQEDATHFLYIIPGCRLRYRKSSDLLQSFSEEVIITDKHISGIPDMVINTVGDLFVTWAETSGDNNVTHIYFSRSTEGTNDDNSNGNENNSNNSANGGSGGGCFLKTVFE